MITRCRRRQDLGDIPDGNGPHRLAASSDESEDSNRSERARHVIDQVVTVAEDHAGLDDGPLQPASADDFLRIPLGSVVFARPVRARTKKAQKHDASYVSRPRRPDDGRGALNVYTSVGLIAQLAVDAGAMHHGSTSCKGPLECLAVRDVDACPTPDDHYLVAAGTQQGGKMTAHEARPAGDRDP